MREFHFGSNLHPIAGKEYSMAGERTRAKSQAVSPLPWSWSTEWANASIRLPLRLCATLYEEGFASASRFVQDQASHLTNLSECNDPSEVLVYQTEFLEKSLTAWLDESRRAADSVARTLAAK
jgi:hypothetical protein